MSIGCNLLVQYSQLIDRRQGLIRIVAWPNTSFENRRIGLIYLIDSFSCFLLHSYHFLSNNFDRMYIASEARNCHNWLDFHSAGIDWIANNLLLIMKLVKEKLYYKSYLTNNKLALFEPILTWLSESNCHRNIRYKLTSDRIKPCNKNPHELNTLSSNQLDGNNFFFLHLLLHSLHSPLHLPCLLIFSFVLLFILRRRCSEPRDDETSQSLNTHHYERN